MLNVIKKTSVLVALLTMLALPFAAPLQVSAIDEEARQEACKGIGTVTPNGNSDGYCEEVTAENSIKGILATVVNILSWIIGVAAVIMILVGGFRYITSGGDSNGVSSAKNTILYAVVGLVVAVFAQALVQFVLREATNTPTATDNSAPIQRDGPR